MKDVGSKLAWQQERAALRSKEEEDAEDSESLSTKGLLGFL